jgi:phage gp36-like protein
LRYGVPEVAQLERGLTESQSINMHWMMQVRLLMVTSVLITLCHWKVHRKISRFMVCDIARYLLWKSRASEEVRQRYEDAISFKVGCLRQS